MSDYFIDSQELLTLLVYSLLNSFKINNHIFIVEMFDIL
jgi:hypothetical protein